MNERIDSDTLDVDFTKDPRFVHGDTTTEDDLFGMPDYADIEEVWDDKRIDEEIEKREAAGLSLRSLGAKIHDQGNEGSCVSNAYAGAMEDIFILQHGIYVPLSPISLYKRCGSSPNSGSSVSYTLKEASGDGILPLNTPENKAKYAHTMSATGFRQSMPDGWKETGRKFVVLQYAIARSVNAMFTALLKDKPGIVGRRGHSIEYHAPIRRSGRRMTPYKNSWGDDWGDNGYGYDSESYFKSSAGYCVIIMSARMGT